jgi:hypothetical protein
MRCGRVVSSPFEPHHLEWNMHANRWLSCLIAALFICTLGLFGLGCPDDADDDDSVAGDDDDDDDSSNPADDDDDTTYDPNDQDGDGYSTLDDPPDCDDTNPYTYPDAWEYWDYDDNDCDGDIDEQMALHRVCMYQGNSYDGLTVSLGAPGDITGDGLADVLIGTEIRGVLLLEGNATRCEYNTDSTDLTGWADPGAGEGGFASVMATGDINNDGVHEIFVAAPLEDELATDSGVVYMYDPADGDLYDIDATFQGEGDGENLGVTVAAGSDINADGVGDLLIAGRSGGDTWQVHLFFGTVSGMSGTFGTADADTVLSGEMEEADDRLALGFAPDLNGDSASELLIGTPDAGDFGEGMAYLMLSSLVWEDGLFGTSDVRFMPYGNDDENLGASVGGLGNMVGNESDDFYVSAPEENSLGAGIGRVHIFGGDEHSWLGTLSGEEAEASVRLQNSQDFGVAAVSLGDIELDGYTDMAILSSDYEIDEYGFGGLFIVRGKSSGLNPDHALSDRSAHYLAEANDYVGPSLVFAGDMDGDGYGEIALGDYLSGWGDGRLYIIYAPISPLG